MAIAMSGTTKATDTQFLISACLSGSPSLSFVRFHLICWIWQGGPPFFSGTKLFVHNDNNNNNTRASTHPFGQHPFPGHGAVCPHIRLFSLFLLLKRPPACAEIQWSCPATRHREKRVTVACQLQALPVSSIPPSRARLRLPS